MDETDRDLKQAVALSNEEAVKKETLARLSMETQAVQAQGRLDREVFLHAASRLLQLALNGLPGCLHSLRSLRDFELQRFNGDQTAAIRHVVELEASAGEDHPDVVAACLAGIGLPLGLALPLWQRLRRLGLLCEVLGHDSTHIQGQLICTLGGIVTDAEPLEFAALHSLWYILCRRKVLIQASVEALVDSLVDLHGEATVVTRSVFAERQQSINASEMQADANSFAVVPAAHN
jgi:hypothetical protein